MADKTIQLQIITPEKVVFNEVVSQVTIPTTEGEITILPGHIALISSLASGDIVARVNGEDAPMAVSGGFIEVQPTDGGENATSVKILADFAEHVSDLSEDAVAKARARAEELKKMKDNNEVVDFEHYEAELERSLTRVKIADKWKNRKYRM